MFYEEIKIKSNVNCAKCKERLDEPRMLPCGDTVCSRCLSYIQMNKNQFKCIVCNEQHLMPEKGLPINKALLAFLSMQPSEIDRGRSIEELKEKLKILRTNITSLSFSATHAEDKIKGNCIELRNQVQLATELAIQQISVLNEEMINEINQFETYCIKSCQLNEEHVHKALKSAKESELFHSNWSQYLNKTKINDDEVAKACIEVTKLNEKVELEKINLESILCYGFLKFIKNPNKFERLILGSFELVRSNFIESLILSNQQVTQLMKICKFPLSQKWKLLYRATQDGFGAKQFHLKCDKQPKTFIIIKSTNGNVFGGFTERDWSPSAFYEKDANAFIFSFINKYNKQFFMKCISPDHAICGAINYGPTFGGGHDIHICNNSNMIDGSYSNLGVSYEHPENLSNDSKSFLAGSHKFRTAEIEVFTKQ